MMSLFPSIKNKPRTCSDVDLKIMQTAACEVYASMQPPLLNHRFEKLLLEAVDEGLGWLGVSAKRTIYSHLENEFNIKRQDIPRKIEGFADAVEQTFGDAAGLLEIQIMMKLHEKVGDSFIYFPEQRDLVFTEYIKTVKSLDLNKPI